MQPLVSIRTLTPADVEQWQPLRHALWPEVDGPQNDRETQVILDDPDQAVFVADAAGRLVGFVEVSIHPHAIGCLHPPVGYVEGWYVDPSFRRSGVGRALLEHAETWATQRGCAEMASDTQVHNAVSRAAHAAHGYAEIETLVHFAKPLKKPAPAPAG